MEKSRLDIYNDVPVKEWNDMDDIKHQVRLMRAKGKLAKIPTSAILEEQKVETPSSVKVYENFMRNWPAPDDFP